MKKNNSKLSNQEIEILKNFKGQKSDYIFSLKRQYPLAMELSRKGYLVASLFGTFKLNEKYRNEIEQLS